LGVKGENANEENSLRGITAPQSWWPWLPGMLPATLTNMGWMLYRHQALCTQKTGLG